MTWSTKKLGEIENLKTLHEEAICKSFLSPYNKITDAECTFLRLGNPARNEPDCICTNNLNIELVGVYDNKNQAERMWQDARGNSHNKPHDRALLTLKNLDSAIAQKLQKLNDGYYKYSGRIILLCDLQSPLITTTEVEQYIQDYTPFRQDNHFDRYFDEVWVRLHKENSLEYKIYKLE